MINKKEHELMVLKMNMPKTFDIEAHKNSNQFTAATHIRYMHMIELKAKGVKLSQIARLYKISRQRVHQIVNML